VVKTAKKMGPSLVGSHHPLRVAPHATAKRTTKASAKPAASTKTTISAPKVEKPKERGPSETKRQVAAAIMENAAKFLQSWSPRAHDGISAEDAKQYGKQVFGYVKAIMFAAIKITAASLGLALAGSTGYALHSQQSPSCPREDSCAVTYAHGK